MNEIYFIERIIAAGSLDIQDGDDVFVVEIAQQLHFTQGPQTEHRVVEGDDLLDRDLLAGRLVDCRTRRHCLVLNYTW